MKSPKELKEWRNRKKVIYSNLNNVERYTSFYTPPVNHYTPARPFVQTTEKPKSLLTKILDGILSR